MSIENQTIGWIENSYKDVEDKKDNSNWNL